MFREHFVPDLHHTASYVCALQFARVAFVIHTEHVFRWINAELRVYFMRYMMYYKVEVRLYYEGRGQQTRVFW